MAPLGWAATAASASSTEPVISASSTPSLDGEAGQFLDLVVGAEQLAVDALHHLGDGLVGNGGELALHEAEEIEIGGIAEIEELEVVLPDLVGELDQLVIGLEDRVGVVEPDAVLDPVERHHLGQLGEADRVHLVDHREDLLLPVVEKVVPVAVVMPGAFEELRDPRLDVLGRHGDGREIDEAVEDAVVDPVRRRHQQVAGVVLAEAFDREIEKDHVEGAQRRRPVLRVAEPELLVVLGPARGLETGVIGVELLPPLGALGRGHIEGARKERFLHVHWYSSLEFLFFVSDLRHRSARGAPEYQVRVLDPTGLFSVLTMPIMPMP
ncbi:MAG: hypothetical protein R3D80_03895 [Paracoccaceae bacterium]